MRKYAKRAGVSRRLLALLGALTLLLMAVPLSSLAASEPVTGEDFTFDADTGTLTLTTFSCQRSEWNEKGVTQEMIRKLVMAEGATMDYVASDMFDGCVNLREVVFPKTLRGLTYSKTFAGCTGIEMVTIHPDNPHVEMIGGLMVEKESYAEQQGIGYLRKLLYGFPSLVPKELVVPEGIEDISGEGLAACSITSIHLPASLIESSLVNDMMVLPSLTAISVDPANPNYFSQDGLLFTKDVDLLVACPQKKGGEITLPEETAVIGPRSFQNGEVKKVTAPGVTEVRMQAFNKSKLEEVVLPKLETMQPAGFSHCSALKSIALPQLTNLPTSTFSSCENLTQVDLPKVTSIGNLAFRDCASLRELVLPETLHSVGTEVFGDGPAPAVLLRSMTGTAAVTDNLAPYADSCYYLPGASGYPADFTQLAAAAITGHPQDAEAVFETNHTYAVAATGGFLQYQWQKKAPGSAAWSDIPGATGAEYTTPALSAADSGSSYRCLVSNPVSPAGVASEEAGLWAHRAAVTPSYKKTRFEGVQTGDLFPRGKDIDFSVMGAGMENDSPVPGDVRALPVGWELTDFADVDNILLSAAFAEGEYGDRVDTSALAEGKVSLFVRLQPQRYTADDPAQPLGSYSWKSYSAYERYQWVDLIVQRAAVQVSPDGCRIEGIGSEQIPHGASPAFRAVGVSAVSGDPVEGDTRYLPSEWLAGGAAGTFDSEGGATLNAAELEPGEHALRVIFAQQRYTRQEDGGYSWQPTGDFAQAQRQITVARAPLAPDPAGNGVAELPANSRVVLGDTVFFTAQGMGMDNLSPLSGDRRYRPDRWQVNPSGDFSTGVRQSFSTDGMEVGEHTLRVVFAEEIYRDGVWQPTGEEYIEEVPFVLEAVAANGQTEQTDQSAQTGQADGATPAASLALSALVLAVVLALVGRTKRRWNSSLLSK